MGQVGWLQLQSRAIAVWDKLAASLAKLAGPGCADQHCKLAGPTRLASLTMPNLLEFQEDGFESAVIPTLVTHTPSGKCTTGFEPLSYTM